MHAASSKWVWIAPAAPRAWTEELLVVAYPEHFVAPTCARVFASDRAATELVDEIHAIVRGFGRDRLWWTVSDTTRPATLEPEIRRRGGEVVERMDVLGLPTGDGLPDLGVPAAIEVRRVRDLSTKRDAHLIHRDGFGGEEQTDEQLSTDLAWLAHGFEDDSTGEVMAYLDGRPAGVGGWDMAGEVCRLWGGATASTLRRRGPTGPYSPNACASAGPPEPRWGSPTPGWRPRHRSCAGSASPVTASSASSSSTCEPPRLARVG
ncbi:MAG: hypothetical protein L0H25_07695 [Micrococcales bacterium]|nr:hypothetical protein [Micrococcales bacterium]